nr:MAG TPA: hypothetical protein [Caudoviricetes sp.]
MPSILATSGTEYDCLVAFKGSSYVRVGGLFGPCALLLHGALFVVGGGGALRRADGQARIVDCLRRL